MTPIITRLHDASPEDAQRIARIYNHYVLNSVATFETQAVSPASMQKRIQAVLDAGLPWLVAHNANGVAGYAYAASWKPRQAYSRTVETTVYIAADSTGNGLGKRLMQSLIKELRTQGLHCALAGIAQPNDASNRLHEALGFVRAGTLREVGWKFDRWIDVGYWQLILDQAVTRLALIKRPGNAGP